MTRFPNSVIWFNRVVIAFATSVMAMIALRNLIDPVAATRAIDISLQSPTAVTVARVGLGGFPLGFAVVLAGCQLRRDRLLIGVTLVAAVIGAATLARVEGLVLDGATAYNVGLLRPEVVMLTASVTGIVLEQRRRRGLPALPPIDAGSVAN